MDALKVTTEKGKIQVRLGETASFELLDTWNNRKVLMIILRLIRGEDGRPLLTFQEIAEALGYPDRRNVNNFWREFEDCGKDLGNLLARKYKIDEEIRDCIIEILISDLSKTAEEVHKEVKERLGLKDRDISIGTVQVIGGDLLRVGRRLRKRLKEGSASYKEGFLIEELFRFIEELLEGGDKARIEKKVEGFKAHVQEVVPLEKEKGDRGTEKLERELFEKGRTISDWASERVLMLLLYFHGISLGVLGKWFRINKSTVLRRLEKFSKIALVVGSLYVGVFSGIMSMDEKWIKIAGIWNYLFVALDNKTHLPLHFEIYPSRSNYYCRLFMLKLKALGYYPKTIITDGWKGYAYAAKKVFPKSIHQLCIFHVMMSSVKWLKEHLKDKDRIKELGKEVKKVFQTMDKRTVMRRLDKLKRFKEIGGLIKNLRRALLKIISAIGSSWIPTTNNALERFNRKFNRFYRARQGFQSRKSAYKQVRLFMLGYIFDQWMWTKKAPLEMAEPRVVELPFYRLWNKPDFSRIKKSLWEELEETA